MIPRIEPDVPHRDDARAGLAVKTPYHEGFVAALKRDLPYEDRYWEPERKFWWVYEDHFDHVAALVVAYWPEVEVIGSGGESDYILERGGRKVAEQGRLL